MKFVILFVFLTLTEAGVLNNVTKESTVVATDSGTKSSAEMTTVEKETVTPVKMTVTTAETPVPAPKNCKLQPKNLTAVLELRDVLYDELKMIRYIIYLFIFIFYFFFFLFIY